MSVEAETRRGGDSRMIILWRGMNFSRWSSIVVCMYVVSFVVFCCLYLVGRASFVKVLMMTRSLFL